MEKIKFLEQQQNEALEYLNKARNKLDNIAKIAEDRVISNNIQKDRIAETLSAIEKRIISIKSENNSAGEKENN